MRIDNSTAHWDAKFIDYEMKMFWQCLRRRRDWIPLVAPRWKKRLGFNWKASTEGNVVYTRAALQLAAGGIDSPRCLLEDEEEGKKNRGRRFLPWQPARITSRLVTGICRRRLEEKWNQVQVESTRAFSTGIPHRSLLLRSSLLRMMIIRSIGGDRVLWRHRPAPLRVLLFPPVVLTRWSVSLPG